MENRLRKLSIWMAEHNIGFSAIAEKANCTPQYANHILRSKSITQKVAARFYGIGIPLELLPPVIDKTSPRGRPPKTGTLPEADQ